MITIDYILEVLQMSNSQVCKLRLRNGPKSLRFVMRHFPSDSRHPDEVVADFANILRSVLDASLGA